MLVSIGALGNRKTYHHPYSEQQSPKADPKQIDPPKLAPHCPSVETFVADGVAGEVVVDVTVVDGVATGGLIALQLPNAALQPVPQ